MEEIKIVDNYMDEREFRNYINTMFYKHNFHPLEIDDVRISDDDEINNNDILVTKDNITYTVQTYLNTKIGEDQITEIIEDMEKENVPYGVIVTNFYADKKIKQRAKNNNIIILDRSELKDGIYK